MKKSQPFLYHFQPRKNAFEAKLLADLTDIHTHFLPGVDDGFQQKESAVSALKDMIDWGVKRVYFTPHIMDDLPLNNPAFLKERFAAFLEDAPTGIDIRLGAEYMLDASFYKQMEEGLLPLGKNHVLIEMSYLYPSPELMNVIYQLRINDYIPLLAHPERYLFMDEKQYRELKEKGCRFQLNLMSLSGQYGRHTHDVAWHLLQHGFYDFAGTDIHHLNAFRHNMTQLKLTKAEQELVRELIRKNDIL